MHINSKNSPSSENLIHQKTNFGYLNINFFSNTYLWYFLIVFVVTIICHILRKLIARAFET